MNPREARIGISIWRTPRPTKVARLLTALQLFGSTMTILDGERVPMEPERIFQTHVHTRRSTQTLCSRNVFTILADSLCGVYTQVRLDLVTETVGHIRGVSGNVTTDHSKPRRPPILGHEAAGILLFQDLCRSGRLHRKRTRHAEQDQHKASRWLERARDNTYLVFRETR